MLHQHFSERGHERVLRQVVGAGVEPDAGVYAALVMRHRLEGDEEAARSVLESMKRAGALVDSCLVVDMKRYEAK
jgi:hypothetical protein